MISGPSGIRESAFGYFVRSADILKCILGNVSIAKYRRGKTNVKLHVFISQPTQDIHLRSVISYPIICSILSSRTTFSKQTRFKKRFSFNSNTTFTRLNFFFVGNAPKDFDHRIAILGTSVSSRREYEYSLLQNLLTQSSFNEKRIFFVNALQNKA